MVAAVLAAFALAIATGSVTIPVLRVVRILLGDHSGEPALTTIVWSVRLPRAVTAAAAGAALGTAGLEMQTLFRNPLADPFIIGVSSGAGLGVAIVVLGAGAGSASLTDALGPLADVGLVVAAALGAAAVLFAVLLVARHVASRVTILVVGLMVGYVASAVVQILLSAASEGAIRSYTQWGLGSFRGTTWEELRIMVPVVICALIIVRLAAKQLDALLLGERYAESLGVHVKSARMVIIGSAAVLAGVVTAFCGPIGFLGIAVPHLARTLLGESSHRILLPGVILVGATVALLAEVVAQLPGSDRTLPVNAVTALIGAPVVVWVLVRGRRHAVAGGEA